MRITNSLSIHQNEINYHNIDKNFQPFVEKAHEKSSGNNEEKEEAEEKHGYDEGCFVVDGGGLFKGGLLGFEKNHGGCGNAVVEAGSDQNG